MATIRLEKEIIGTAWTHDTMLRKRPPYAFVRPCGHALQLVDSRLVLLLQLRDHLDHVIAFSNVGVLDLIIPPI